MNETARKRLLTRTEYVTFELSSWCHRADQHPACWAHHSGPPMHLKEKVIFETLAWLGSAGYSQWLMWSVFNEPAADPKLAYYMYLAQRFCPAAKTYFLTNGDNLDQNLVDLLSGLGVERLRVSCYDDAVEARCRLLTGCRIEISRRTCFDDRLTWTEKRGTVGPREACMSPFRNIIIRADGYLGACCYDARNELRLADLNERRLEDVLGGDEIESAYIAIQRMTKGEQPYHLCQRCTATRPIRGGA